MKSLQEQFLPWDLAIKLKEKGINIGEVIAGYYNTNGEPVFRIKGNPYPCNQPFDIPTFLYQQVFEWFREKHKLYGEIFWDSETFFWWILNLEDERVSEIEFKTQGSPIEEVFINHTFEEAQISCIEKLLTLI